MKAIALISGGLDSILAAKVIKDQNVEIFPLNFRIPFCHRDKEVSSKSDNTAQLVRDNLGQELKIIDISEGFLKLLDKPKHGFGSNMNPCIDCKIFMLSEVKELMKEIDAQFVVTGEVLGQRPMSQHKDALQVIAKRSGLENLVLRPLSAKLLPETIPESSGWVKRSELLNFSGRSRRPQLDLANNFGIKDFAWPAGGCLLTDPEFSKRLKDLIAYKELNTDNTTLLKLGRHFRLSASAKLIVGRDEKEDLELEKLVKPQDYLFYPNEQLAGPTSLARGNLDTELIRLSAQITCRYCDLNNKTEAAIFYKKFPSQESNSVMVSSIEEDQLQSLRI
ncbi:MAG: tRNA 4-thiouridine(8) synthase ThiI [Candidatus Omnitrophica bacterium]|nr:tRNA 4-thiouridine(8) synthase ThiI [Candidatus Omnitrophota bacterium]